MFKQIVQWVAGETSELVLGESGSKLAAAEAEAEAAAPLEAYVDGAEMRDKDGRRYQLENVRHKGWDVDATLRRIDKERKPAGMSSRQFRKAQKAERRLERDRRQRRLEAARAKDQTPAEEAADDVAELEALERYPWRRTS
jgi:hypothetical protein